MKTNQRTLTPFIVLYILANLSAFHAMAQSPMVKEQTAICKIKVGGSPQTKLNGLTSPAVQDKTYERKVSETGFFDRVSHIQPMQTVQIELSYPEGKAGEKVSIMVADGGTLDNGKKVKVAQLDKQSKFSFGFQAAQNAGIYRIIVRKGFDSKVVQLWVGAEENVTKN